MVYQPKQDENKRKSLADILFYTAMTIMVFALVCMVVLAGYEAITKRDQLLFKFVKSSSLEKRGADPKVLIPQRDEIYVETPSSKMLLIQRKEGSTFRVLVCEADASTFSTLRVGAFYNFSANVCAPFPEI
jgi:hypothetical protein